MEPDEGHELAIIYDIHIGMRDCPNPVLWFTTVTIQGSALQVFPLSVAEGIIKGAGAYQLKDLEGKPCIVTRDSGKLTFVEVFKI